VTPTPVGTPRPPGAKEGRVVDFYFDLSSPYSHLASTQVAGLHERTGAEVRWRPVVVSAIFKAAQNTMPAASPPKASYMFDDLKRWATRYGVPFRFSPRFPINAMKAHRMICAAELGHGQAEAGTLGRRLFEAVWVDDLDITDGAELVRLADGCGLPGAALAAATETQPVKDRLRANTDEAIARGAFGVPAFVHDGVLYWGNDRLDFLEGALR
jgi:2-hydroxychromene-2-carboxylate isomerase